MAKCNIIPLFIPFSGCPVRCVYCEQSKITGVSSHLSGDDVRSTIREALEKNGRNSAELAFYGGTFTMLAPARQDELLKAVAPFLESGEIASIRLSTRPEKIRSEDWKRLYDAGVRTIEFGIQSMDPEVLQASKREILPEEMEKTVHSAKEAGFIVGLQQMIGLPKDSLERDIMTAKWIADRADFVRIYPTVIFRDTELEKMYRSGIYRPLSLSEAIDYSAKLLTIYETSKVPVIRVGLPQMRREDYLVGPYHDNFREFAETKRAVDFILNRYDRIRLIEGSSKEINRIVGPYGWGRRRLERRYGSIRFRRTRGDLIIDS